MKPALFAVASVDGQCVHIQIADLIIADELVKSRFGVGRIQTSYAPKFAVLSLAHKIAEKRVVA